MNRSFKKSKLTLKSVNRLGKSPDKIKDKIKKLIKNNGKKSC